MPVADIFEGSSEWITSGWPFDTIRVNEIHELFARKQWTVLVRTSNARNMNLRWNLHLDLSVYVRETTCHERGFVQEQINCLFSTLYQISNSMVFVNLEKNCLCNSNSKLTHAIWFIDRVYPSFIIYRYSEMWVGPFVAVCRRSKHEP